METSEADPGTGAKPERPVDERASGEAPPGAEPVPSWRAPAGARDEVFSPTFFGLRRALADGEREAGAKKGGS
jgi:hypothetical protein